MVGCVAAHLVVQHRNGPQHHQREHRAQHRRGFAAQPGGHADGGREPDASGCGQALDLAFGIALEDGARAQKPHARDDALQHAAVVCRFNAGLLSHQHEQGRAHRHQHVRAHASGLARVFAFPTQQPAQQRCHGQAHHDARGLCRIGHVREFRGHRAGDLLPEVSHGHGPCTR